MVNPAKQPMPIKRRLVLTLLIVVITLVPAIVMLLVTWAVTGLPQGAATWASLPAITGMAAAASGGRRFGVLTAVVMAISAPLAIVAGLSPVSGAALMALLCLLVGRLSRVGLHKSAIMVPIMLAWPLIDPPTWSGASSVDRLNTDYLLWMSLFFFVGGVFAALVTAYALRKRPKAQHELHPRRESMAYTVIITILVTVSTFYVLDHPKQYGGAFLIAAILVLAPIGDAQTLKPTFWRVIGTLAGTLFVLAIVAKVNSLALVYLVGLVLIVIALVARFGRLPWIYYVFMMPATACLNATSLTQVGQLGEQRAVDNLVGGVLVLVAVAAAIAYSRWATAHGHASNNDPETEDLIDPPKLATVAS